MLGKNLTDPVKTGSGRRCECDMTRGLRSLKMAQRSSHLHHHHHHHNKTPVICTLKTVAYGLDSQVLGFVVFNMIWNVWNKLINVVIEGNETLTILACRFPQRLENGTALLFKSYHLVLNCGTSCALRLNLLWLCCSGDVPRVLVTWTCSSPWLIILIIHVDVFLWLWVSCLSLWKFSVYQSIDLHLPHY